MSLLPIEVNCDSFLLTLTNLLLMFGDRAKSTNLKRPSNLKETQTAVRTSPPKILVATTRMVIKICF